MWKLYLRLMSWAGQTQMQQQRIGGWSNIQFLRIIRKVNHKFIQEYQTEKYFPKSECWTYRCIHISLDCSVFRFWSMAARLLFTWPTHTSIYVLPNVCHKILWNYKNMLPWILLQHLFENSYWKHVTLMRKRWPCLGPTLTSNHHEYAFFLYVITLNEMELVKRYF